MRNTDLVNYVGFSTGGTGTTGVKVRFATDVARRTKVLAKIGATDITFYQLPNAMTKAEAVTYLSKHTDNKVLEQACQDAISQATNRLIPNKPGKVVGKNVKKKVKVKVVEDTNQN